MYRTTSKYRRLELMLEGGVPTRTEIRSYLGPSLAQILDEYSKETERKLLGLESPLKGVDSRKLWISPSDQLAGKIGLKPPLTNKYMKACTHLGILEVGEYTVRNFERTTEERLRRELEKKFDEERKMLNAEKRHAVDASVKKARQEHEIVVANIRANFEQELKRAFDDAETKSTKRIQKAMIQQRLDLEMEMMKRLREEVGKVVSSLNEEFELCFRAERLNMIADFNAIMRRERKKVEARMKAFEDKKIRDLCAQRREFETEKIADNSYILCKERMRCVAEMHAIRQCYEKKIEALENLLLERKGEDLESKGEKKSTERSAKNMFQVVEIIDKDGNSWRPVQLELEAPRVHCTEEEALEPLVSSKINFFPPDEYTDQVAKASSSSVASRDSLPFCYYENRLYIRSDYREKNVEIEKAMEEPKTMAELAEEGGRFIMEMKRLKSCCIF